MVDGMKVDEPSRKVVWITGASSGIGEALAAEYSHRPVDLILSARRLERLEGVRKNCAATAQIHCLVLDLEDLASLSKAAQEVLSTYGRVDLLINNAGLSQRAYAFETDISVDDRLMRINYLGTVALTKAVLGSMIERRTGHVAVVSSVLGVFGAPMRSAYAASKHALHGYFDSLRAEVLGKGIRVSLICPGYVKTDLPKHALRGDGSQNEVLDRTSGMPAREFARRMIVALDKCREEVYIGGSEVFGIYLKRFFPRLLSKILVGKNQQTLGKSQQL